MSYWRRILALDFVVFGLESFSRFIKGLDLDTECIGITLHGLQWIGGL